MTTTTDTTARTAHLLELMKAGDDAFNTQDFEAMQAVHHPDVLCYITGSDEPTIGWAAHRSMMEDLFEWFPDIEVHNSPYPIQFGADDWIAVVSKVTGTLRRAMKLPDGSTLAATGRSFDVNFHHRGQVGGRRRSRGMGVLGLRPAGTADRPRIALDNSAGTHTSQTGPDPRREVSRVSPTLRKRDEMSHERFTDKTAVVTGGAGNIGRAVAERIAAEGAKVLAVDVGEEGLKETVALITSNGGTARYFVADVTDAASVAAYADAAAELGGGLVHAFFNNAGIEGQVAPIDGYEESAFDQVLAVNVRGVFLGLRYVAAKLQRGGAIVNSSSVAGLKGFPGGAAYVASKHAVIGLTKVAALDLAPSGIRVNAVAPGPVEGRMMSSLEEQMGFPDAHAALLSGVPLGRYATPDDIASTVTFLLSDEAGFATGATFSIDGGQTT